MAKIVEDVRAKRPRQPDFRALPTRMYQPIMPAGQASAKRDPTPTEIDATTKTAGGYALLGADALTTASRAKRFAIVSTRSSPIGEDTLCFIRETDDASHTYYMTAMAPAAPEARPASVVPSALPTESLTTFTERFKAELHSKVKPSSNLNDVPAMTAAQAESITVTRKR